MKIFKSSQVREIDAYTIENEPIKSIDLMERASKQLAKWIIKKFEHITPFKIFIGPGNNGGDGLALARLLAENGYQVFVYILKLKDLTGDPETNYKRLVEQNKAEIQFISSEKDFPKFEKKDVVVDALFGSGLTRPLEGLAAKQVEYINSYNNKKIAIDIPSGLFGEDNTNNVSDNIIRANYTLSFQFPNLSFFFPENEIFTGEWHILPIGLHEDIIDKLQTGWFSIDKKTVSSILKIRTKFSHKGTFGHALLISGSYGKMGAAVLASKACLRTGAGLVTTHVPKLGYQIIQTAIPEAMVSIDTSDEYFTEIPDLEKYNAIGIGPGIDINIKTQQAFKKLLENIKAPLVIDADGLNILAKNKNWLEKLPGESILTPHPKEFERIFGKSGNSYEQNQLQTELSKKYNIFIILKYAHTCITCPDGISYFNTTGNPGMATAGSGDVLTGMILSLLAQGYSPKNASILGVYLHGLAGDLAMKKTGQEALIASDIIEKIGKAYKKIKSN